MFAASKKSTIFDLFWSFLNIAERQKDYRIRRFRWILSIFRMFGNHLLVLCLALFCVPWAQKCRKTYCFKNISKRIKISFEALFWSIFVTFRTLFWTKLGSLSEGHFLDFSYFWSFLQKESYKKGPQIKKMTILGGVPESTPKSDFGRLCRSSGGPSEGAQNWCLMTPSTWN